MYFEILRPYYFMWASLRLTPFFLSLAYFLMAIGLYLCTYVAPSDFQQGENYRIIYVHVPAAWMSLFIYILISLTSFFYLVTKHPILNLFSQSGVKLGLTWTFITLCTGCFWGKPMWGTFWVWDARLTSVLILFFIYLGALRFFEFSADLGSIFVCIGLINIPIIKFSVKWWNTLHQPSSISQFGTSIHISMLVPLLFMFFSFFLISLVFVSLDARKFILTSYSFSLKKIKKQIC